MGLKVKAIALLITLSVSFSSGWFANGWRLGQELAKTEAYQAKESAKLAQSILKIERLNQEKAQAISAKTLAEEAAQKTRATIVTKEVLKYVQSPSTGTCIMPDGWVQSHDNATGVSRPSETTSAPPGIPTGAITDREALVAVTNNYNICLDNAVKHRGLIAWAKALTATEPD